MNLRQVREDAAHMNKLLSERENFSERERLLKEVHLLKDELNRRRMNETQLKLKLAEYQNKGELSRFEENSGRRSIDETNFNGDSI